MHKVLVCGGAGYIGSHMVKMLCEQGYEVVTFDNLSTGHSSAVKWGELFIGDLLMPISINEVFRKHKFDAVFHFATLSLVSESITYPDIYYRNNVIGTLNLLEAMKLANVKNFIFSATAAINDEQEYIPKDETHIAQPINPYGTTSLSVERILQNNATEFGLNSASLRYFNTAGADPSGTIGEQHEPETHLIPNVLNAILAGSGSLSIFGDDYNTSDGTCIRDYIHINDLCHAHLLALHYLQKQQGAFHFYLGNGEGFSILDIVQAAEEVTGKSVPYRVKKRRFGDPAILVANSELAKKQLGWQPQYTQLQDIIETAWNWHLNMHSRQTACLSNTTLRSVSL